MRAKVKATGEIVEIYRFVDTEQNEWIDCYLDFLEPIATDYWTRLEHQYAGLAMQGLCANTKFMRDHEGDFQCNEDMIAVYAKDVAHALADKYKKEE